MFAVPAGSSRLPIGELVSRIEGIVHGLICATSSFHDFKPPPDIFLSIIGP